MYLKQASFRNCQSLKNIDLDFCSGLNVIGAPDNSGNSTGKSVFFKCLRTAVGAEFFDTSEVVHLISYGENVASALFTLSDGSAGGFLAATRKITYLYKACSISKIERLTSPHHEFLRKMSIVMDTQSGFVLNILDADQELLFVNSREDTNFSILKLVSNNETLEEVIPQIEEKMSTLGSLCAKVEYTNVELHRQHKILKVSNIHDMEQRILYGERLLPLCQHIVKIKNDIEAIKPWYFTDIKDACTLLSLYRCYESMHLLICGIKHEKIVAADVCATLLNLNLYYSDIHHNLLSVKQTYQILYDEGFYLLNYLQMFEDILNFLFEIKKNTIEIENLESRAKNIQVEMGQLNLIVQCPIKGRVCFFEDGCLEVCEDFTMLHPI